MKFHALTVTGIEKTIRDAVVLTLQPMGEDAPFEFTQGQYLTFKRDFDGEELRRSYSICSGKQDGELKVGIKRVEGGAFSTWANTELAIGDTIKAMPPMGNFHARAQSDHPHYLAFAAGSGITPVLSILKTALCEEPACRFTLVYSNKNPGTIMFREELEDLKNIHVERLNVIHVLTDSARDIDLFQGRLDKPKCAALLECWIDINSVAMAYICGPHAMMKTVAAALEDHGLSREQIRFELFADNQPGRAKAPAASAAFPDKGVEGRVIIGGESCTLTIDRDTSLLDAALVNNLDAPYACKAGVCSTCKAKVLEGDVEMIANHALEDDEVDAGYVLSCQSFPVSSAKVVWDYDQGGQL